MTGVAQGAVCAYHINMASYSLKLFRSVPGSTVRTGDGALHFDVGDDATAIRYAKSELSDALERSEIVELWCDDNRLVWEKPIA